MDGLIEKANVLIEALPYIRTFFGKTFVIKYGGSAMTDAELKKAVMLDVILLKYVGLNPVIVHGGGSSITEVMARMGKKPSFVHGRRVTDAETMEIVEMVLVGKINKEIVALINKYGGRAVGLSGKDGNLIIARKYVRRIPKSAGVGAVLPALGPGAGLQGVRDQDEEIDLGFVGEVETINPEMIHILNREGYIPVISSIGVGYQGESYNVNADSVAGELAAALRADKLIMLTDVEGIFEEQSDPGSLISALQVDRARRLIEEGKIAGGMIPKVEACIKALECGVQRTHVIDGRTLHSMLLEIFTDKGIGTMVVT